MTKRTRKLQFDKKTMSQISARDGGCIFCNQFYHMKNTNPFTYQIYDVMHFINKSQGGLGIEQNGAIGCRYHHSLLDNGNKGIRDEMLMIFERYLMNLYPRWNKEDLIYKKI